jgi:hypothetical protein
MTSCISEFSHPQGFSDPIPRQIPHLHRSGSTPICPLPEGKVDIAVGKQLSMIENGAGLINVSDLSRSIFKTTVSLSRFISADVFIFVPIF